MPNPLRVVPWPVRFPVSSKRVSARSKLTGSSSCPSLQPRPVDRPEGLGEHLLVPRRLGVLDRPGAPGDGAGVVTLLLAEPAVPAEQFGTLAERAAAVLSLEQAQSPGDPAEGVRVALEPSLDLGDLEREAGFADRVVTEEASGRPVGGRSTLVAAGAVPRVPEGLVHRGELCPVELGQAAPHEQRPLVELGDLDVGVGGLGPFGSDERVGPCLRVPLGVQVMEREELGLVLPTVERRALDGVACARRAGCAGR